MLADRPVRRARVPSVRATVRGGARGHRPRDCRPRCDRSRSCPPWRRRSSLALDGPDDAAPAPAGCAVAIGDRVALGGGLGAAAVGDERIDFGRRLPRRCDNVLRNVALCVAATESLRVARHGACARAGRRSGAARADAARRGRGCSSARRLRAALVVLAYDRFHQRMLLAATVGLLPLSAFAVRRGGLLAAPARARRDRAAVRWRASILVVAASRWLWRRCPAVGVAATGDAAAGDAHRFTRGSLTVRRGCTVHRRAADGARGGRHGHGHGDRAGAAGRASSSSSSISAGRPVYFLCDMYCEPQFQAGATAPLCDAMFERFVLTPVVEETLHSRTYGLYRISGPASGDPAPRECPRRSDRDLAMRSVER